MNGRTETVTWSDRQQVVAVILLAGAMILLISYFLLWPMNKKRRQLEKDNRAMATQLSRQNYGGDESTLTRRKFAEEHLRDKLRGQWTDLASRLGAFEDETRKTNTPVGHITYKVSLHNAREAMRQKAMTRGIPVPYELGMDENVESQEDARKLLLQLRAVEKVVSLALDLKIDAIQRVKPLQLYEHRIGDKQELYLEEYPVFMTFHGRMNTVYALFQNVMKPGNACLFRHMRTEKLPPGPVDMLEVDVVISTLVFVRGLDELTWPAPQRTIMNPGGH